MSHVCMCMSLEAQSWLILDIFLHCFPLFIEAGSHTELRTSQSWAFQLANLSKWSQSLLSKCWHRWPPLLPGSPWVPAFWSPGLILGQQALYLLDHLCTLSFAYIPLVSEACLQMAFPESPSYHGLLLPFFVYSHHCWWVFMFTGYKDSCAVFIQCEVRKVCSMDALPPPTSRWPYLL